MSFLSDWEKSDTAKNAASLVAQHVYIPALIYAAGQYFTKEEMEEFNQCLVRNFKIQCPESANRANHYMKPFFLKYCRDDFRKAKAEAQDEPA